MLTAVKSVGRTKGLTMIFDSDEEYSFSGIKQLIAKNPTLAAELLICPEPTNLKLINSCRGLLEMSLRLKGKSAHAARPQLGINAITGAVNLVKQLKQKLSDSSINLAYLQGGLAVNSSIAKQANAVPDRAIFTLDIRPDWQHSQPKISKLISSICRQQQLGLESTTIKLNYPGYFTPKSSLHPFIKIIRQTIGPVIYQTPKLTGYYEAALTNQAWSIPSVIFGPTGPSHTSDEYVTTDSLQKCQSVYQQLIEYYCK
jgi:acetylornithine deacetylase/succinyl-diaminopimelate desuccinylase-like protein